MADAVLRTSFSRLALYDDCPLRYRYIEVLGQPEPGVSPDWRRAPEALLSGVMAFDRSFGVAVHHALQSWQAAIDAGAPVDPDALLHDVDAVTTALVADPAHLAHARARLLPHLAAYARGPWPRRRTLALERSLHLGLPRRSEAPAIELAIRLDRVAAIPGGAAILDFKSVSPHAAQRRRDRWQLRTYALAAAALGLAPGARLRLVIVDLVGGRTVEVAAAQPHLDDAERRLLACARGIVHLDFDIAAYPRRPCWSCGFRLTCPSSLAAGPS